jgi:hypothetical protein
MHSVPRRRVYKQVLLAANRELERWFRLRLRLWLRLRLRAWRHIPVASAARKRYSFFECFPYVCPEPVLAK